MRSWFSTFRLWLLAAFLVGTFVGVSGFTFWYAKGYSYLSNRPEACVNCHVMKPQYEAWSHGAHRLGATCADCHLPHQGLAKWFAKAEHGYRHSKAFTFGEFHEPIQMGADSQRLVEDNCRRCHMNLVTQIDAHSAQPAQKILCTRCHAGIGHGVHN